MPSLAASLWVKAEQERVAALGGVEHPAEIAERAYDAAHRLGVTVGRAQAGALPSGVNLHALAVELRAGAALAGGK